MCSAIRKPGWEKSTVLLHHWKFKCNKYCYRIGKKSGANQWTILLLGELGTGKELIAHATHNTGSTANMPL